MIGAVLDEAVAAGHPPAAQCCVIVDGQVVFQSAHGCTNESVFDVASVTKVVATTSALAWLVERGALGLDDEVQRFLPSSKARTTLRALLGHRSGLAAWRPFFAEVIQDPVAGPCFDRTAKPGPVAWARARSMVTDDVLEQAAQTPGRRVYSDLGFITLGAVVEAATNERLDRFCARTLHKERELGFVDLTNETSWLDGRHVLATGKTRPREPAPGQEDLFDVPPQDRRDDAGHVDDDNAFAMGGVAGHAGVFGTAQAIARFAYETWVEDGPLGATRDTFLTLDSAEGSPRALGWDVPTPGSTAGALGDGASVFGHLGFTGCSLWMDLERRLSVALLTNRTLPGRQHVAGIRALRPRFHDAVAAWLEAR